MEVIKETDIYRRVKSPGGSVYRLYKKSCVKCANLIYVKYKFKSKENICINCAAKIKGENRIGKKATEEHKRKMSLGVIKAHRDGKFNHLKKPYTQASFDATYNSYIKEANIKKLEWDITEYEFRVLTKENCYYCGKEPSQSRNAKNRLNGYYIYNGLDRTDNRQGYILSNVVPCCKECNYSKKSMTRDAFLTMVKRIYEFQNKKGCYENRSRRAG